MAHDKQGRCPGCSKHCPIGHPRCKYGRAYFDKMALKAEKKTEKKPDKNPDKKTAAPKWAAYVEKNGLAWQLLHTSRSVKKALKEKKATEAQLLSALTDAEQAALGMLLSKLSNQNEA